MAKDVQLTVSSAPHIRSKETTSQIMFNVILALLPATLAGIYYFGSHGLWLMIACSLVAVVTEAVWQKLRGVPVTITDGSALLTGLLLALTLPPTAPLWMASLGSIIAIVLGKHVFGGLGYNFFNPALIGRAFLMASFPVAMTTFKMVDVTSQATPLKAKELTSVTDLFLGSTGGSLGETSVAAIVLGGLYLLYKGYIDWRIPTGYLGTVAILTSLLGSKGPIFHLLAGGLVLGAFFMATDMVTTPVTKKGRLIFGIGCGFLTVLIRLYGGYPEGVMYSILLMNLCVPLIDQYTQPQVFGEVKANG
ncbi:electron transport complex, RnfABCDGE type, D subunit [Halobacteroides halobius DSM 5150]|uniref:Ion-translocating oxidoreductase complex subunit D n=1 Tax=Halobacteroides halobius (strain ATCC 35273 / DSM 5150 / MD-1) TaxID=748449 RepID=L0KC15_HALHC|nr:RnfABCDGE type electron transport complex subunit D [Halobacteroides halobius]AGB41909.1 electron transport complex, RnfABCDGE type, D subunit [Halobacteroides halobius DSM 5150]